MTDEAPKTFSQRIAWILTGSGLITVLAAVLVVALVIKLFFPATPQFADSGPLAPLNWVVQDARTGEPIDMRAYEGEVLVLNFWATWCPPCRIEKPAINRLDAAMAGEGLKVLAVSLQEEPGTVRNYLESAGYTLPTAIIPTAPPSAFEIPGVPTTYVINRRGEIVLMQVGAYTGWDGKAMQDQLRGLLGS